MKVLIKLAIGALLLTLKLSNKPMGTSFIPPCAIIAVLIIAFLFACRISKQYLMSITKKEFAISLIPLTKQPTLFLFLHFHLF